MTKYRSFLAECSWTSAYVNCFDMVRVFAGDGRGCERRRDRDVLESLSRQGESKESAGARMNSVVRLGFVVQSSEEAEHSRSSNVGRRKCPFGARPPNRTNLG